VLLTILHNIRACLLFWRKGIIKITLLIYIIHSPLNIVYSHELRILTVNEPPANYLNEAGIAEGYVIDIVKKLQQEIGNKSKIEFVPEARALNILSTRNDAIFFSLSKTKFRENKYTWLGKVMSKKWHVYALKASTLAVENINQLQKLPVLGVVRGDVREEWLVNRQFTNLHSVTNHRQNVLRLLNSRIPAFVYEKQGLLHICKELNIDANLFKVIHTINIAPVYIVMSKGISPDILNLWQSTFNKLLTNGDIEEISRHWQSKLWNEFKITSDISNGILIF